MDEDRRRLINGGAAAGAAALLPNPAAGQDFILDPILALPDKPTRGKPGDFNFLTGEWRIHNRQIRDGIWTTFPGEATVNAIMGGLGSVEDLRIPVRKFGGMGLRLLDVEAGVWSDFWVNARSGVLSTPGQTGSFEDGAGIFVSDDVMDGKPIKAVGVWDRITTTSCRWRQATSTDGGKTWSQNWIMDWTRV